MPSPRILIVDDEPLARQRLTALLAELGGFEVAGECGNGRDGVIAAQELEAGIILLDIRMPGMDGMEAARHLAKLEQPPAVIFTTAYGDHALDAFEANAIDYLLKPIRRERLQQALVKARRLQDGQIEALHGQQPMRTHISVRRQGALELVAIDDIRYFQADQKYTSIGCAGQEYLCEDSLALLEKEFSGRFLSIHHNALVAIPYIKSLSRNKDGTWLIQLRDVVQALKVSRRHVRAVRRRIST